MRAGVAVALTAFVVLVVGVVLFLFGTAFLVLGDLELARSLAALGIMAVAVAIGLGAIVWILDD